MPICGEYRFDQHFNMGWLRPESALWDAIAGYHLRAYVRSAENTMEIGIGNGFNSFINFDGEFKSSFDWFFNVDASGFWNNVDIFDVASSSSLASNVVRNVPNKFSLVVDHKPNLLSQCKELEISEKYLVHDCNAPIPTKQQFDCIYSNIFYWLQDPIQTLESLKPNIREGGTIVIAFPNQNFYRYCPSYLGKGRWFELINRGRKSHIMWHLDIEDLERRLKKNNIFKLSRHISYLGESTLNVWDYGLRCFSSPLISMANKLTLNQRAEVKKEWLENCRVLAGPLLENEREATEKNLGGFQLCELIAV